MPDLKRLPLPGEWWETRNGLLAYVGCRVPNTGSVLMSTGSELSGWIRPKNETEGIWGCVWGLEGKVFPDDSSESDYDIVTPLPECTGWEWKKPEWAPLDPETYGWHRLRAGVDWVNSILQEGEWDPVNQLAGRVLGEVRNRDFRCLKEDLPTKPVDEDDETVVLTKKQYQQLYRFVNTIASHMSELKWIDASKD